MNVLAQLRDELKRDEPLLFYFCLTGRHAKCEERKTVFRDTESKRPSNIVYCECPCHARVSVTQGGDINVREKKTRAREAKEGPKAPIEVRQGTHHQEGQEDLG